MSQEAPRQFEVFDQANLDQDINASGAVTDAQINLFGIIAGSQQERACRIIWCGDAIERIEHKLHFIWIGNKQFKIFHQNERRQIALSSLVESMGKMLPGSCAARVRGSTDIVDQAALSGMVRP